MELTDIKGVGPKKQEALARMGIDSVAGLLAYYPYAYQDRTHLTRIADAVPGREYFMEVTVKKITAGRPRGRGKGLTKMLVSDGTGSMDLVFFLPSYYFSRFRPGDRCRVYGKLEENGQTLEMIHPDISDGEDAGNVILPLYRTAKGISQNQMRGFVRQALAAEDEMTEFLPAELLGSRKIAGRAFALRNIHFPADRASYAAARYRLIYEELFLFLTGLSRLRGAGTGEDGRVRGIAFPHDDYAREFAASLGYELTGAQKRVIGEIEADMESDRQMQRLLQGDVGSGKTAVAAAVLYKAVRDGCQGALMAPTELLAAQHYEKFRKLFEPRGIRVGMLSGSQKAAEKNEVKKRLAAGELDIVIGTHAVIQPDVVFSNLGLVVTDEQHRFGVNQRVALSDKGGYPDTLVMTATPIPRSLAVILFGGMDISAIDELPAGRKPIETKVVSPRARKTVYREVARVIRDGHQAYVVAPLVADSEAVDARSAESLFEELDHAFGKHGITVGLLNGAMKPEEKDRVMTEFADGRIQILVATVVIEVGIDVPNATVMVIENAERFGLAQMHQLRGRVGRGADQSYCFLITKPDSGLGMQRAEILAGTSDGFVIAEKDLQMRGPGDFFGTRQHGLPELHTADLVKNADILAGVSRDVRQMLAADPELKQPEHQPLKEAVRKMYGETALTNIGI